MTAVPGMPYIAVGMHKAVDSAMGLPSMSTSASRMLWLLTPPEVRRSFMAFGTVQQGRAYAYWTSLGVALSPEAWIM